MGDKQAIMLIRVDVLPAGFRAKEPEGSPTWKSKSTASTAVEPAKALRRPLRLERSAAA